MKKILNKTIVAILSALMCCSFMLGIGYKTNWSGLIAKAEDYATDYKSLSYDDLDDITYRSTESATSAQITVFTHGLGGSGKHWTNRSWKNEKGIKESKKKEVCYAKRFRQE